MSLGVIASGNARTEFVDINVASLGMARDHRRDRRAVVVRHLDPQPPRACTDTATGGDGNRRVGSRSGSAFGVVVIASFGSGAGGEWFSGYLIEYSLSIDNVFVWALILAYFKVACAYQRRVLFWGVFGALVLRAAFIFAGVALITRFEWMLFIFGGSCCTPQASCCSRTTTS